MKSADKTVQSLVTLIQAASGDSSKRAVGQPKFSTEQQFSSILSSLHGNPISVATLREVKNGLATSGSTKYQQWSSLLDKAIKSYGSSGSLSSTYYSNKPEVSSPIPSRTAPVNVEIEKNANYRKVDQRPVESYRVQDNRLNNPHEIEFRGASDDKSTSIQLALKAEPQPTVTYSSYIDDGSQADVKINSKDIDSNTKSAQEAESKQGTDGNRAKEVNKYQVSTDTKGVGNAQKNIENKEFIPTSKTLQTNKDVNSINQQNSLAKVNGKENQVLSGKIVVKQLNIKENVGLAQQSQGNKFSSTAKTGEDSLKTVKISSSSTTGKLEIQSEEKLGKNPESKTLQLGKAKLAEDGILGSPKEAESSGKQGKISESAKQTVSEGVFTDKPKISTALLSSHIDKIFGDGAAKKSNLKVSVEPGEKQIPVVKSDLVASSFVKAVLVSASDKNSGANLGQEIKTSGKASEESSGKLTKSQQSIDLKQQVGSQDGSTLTDEAGLKKSGSKLTTPSLDQQASTQNAKLGANVITVKTLGDSGYKVASQYNQGTQGIHGNQGQGKNNPNSHGTLSSQASSQVSQSKTSFEQQQGQHFSNGQGKPKKISSADHGRPNPKSAIDSGKKSDIFTSLLSSTAKSGQNGISAKFTNPLRQTATTASQLHNVLKSTQISKTSGEQVIRVQLKPVELGSVDIKFLFSEDDAVKVVIVTDNKDTMTLVEKDKQSILQSLKDCGYQCDDNSLKFSLSQGEQGKTQNQDHENKFSNIEQKNARKESTLDDTDTEGLSSHDGSVDVII